MTATATAATKADRIKSVFRQVLTALRYAVAAAVTVVVVMTAVYAFHVVARTGDLTMQVLNSYISVDPPQNQSSDLKLSFTLSVYNPSGRVRFYYTDIQCKLEVNDSHIDTSAFGFPDMVVPAKSGLKIGPTNASFNSTSRDFVFHDLFQVNGRNLTGNLTLSGNLTVSIYYNNKTIGTTKYYCSSLTVGNVNGSSSGMDSSTSCLTNIEEMPSISPTLGWRRGRAI